MAGANEPYGGGGEGPGLLNRPKKWGGGSTRLAQKVFPYHIFAIFTFQLINAHFSRQPAMVGVLGQMPTKSETTIN